MCNVASSYSLAKFCKDGKILFFNSVACNNLAFFSFWTRCLARVFCWTTCFNCSCSFISNWLLIVLMVSIVLFRARSWISNLALFSLVALVNSLLTLLNSVPSCKFLPLASFNPAEISVIYPFKRDVDFCKPIFASSNRSALSRNWPIL